MNCKVVLFTQHFCSVTFTFFLDQVSEVVYSKFSIVYLQALLFECTTVCYNITFEKISILFTYCRNYGIAMHVILSWGVTVL